MCQSCETMVINGILCHEIGCPDSWKDYKKECKWCGREFKPKEENQVCCTKLCKRAYCT